MIATINSFSLNGLRAKPLLVECDLTNGLPSLSIVGIPNKYADGIRERVRSAIHNCGLAFPRKRITVNLAPAGEAVDGSTYDLPIALAILARSDQLDGKLLRNSAVVGELGLDGTLRPVRGILTMATMARSKQQLLVAPVSNRSQLQLVPNLSALTCDSLRDLYNALIDKNRPMAVTVKAADNRNPGAPEVNFSEIVGQAQAKRALEIAAAGRHNILLTGPPGTGKSMLAKATAGILPALNDDEICELSQIYSLVSAEPNLVQDKRPYRSPHHSASHVALVGGGQFPRPGEISLSHRGVLLLDEIAEFSKQSLEALRQPLEDRKVVLARAQRTTEYPADFMLIATMNPCPCGYYGDTKKECSCSVSQLVQYQKKLSGPLLDRIDLQVRVDRPEAQTLQQLQLEEASEIICQRVTRAHLAQHARYKKAANNSAMSSAYIRQHWRLNSATKKILFDATEKLQLSMRSHFRILRVARTIADLDGTRDIEVHHLTEALQYRLSDANISAVHA